MTKPRREHPMFRLWSAAAILALLLGLSLANAWYVRRLTAGIGAHLEQAQLLAEADSWAEAEALTRRAWQDWDGEKRYVYSLLQHEDADQILRSFRAVLQYVKIEEMDQYAAANAELIAQLELLSEMEQPSLLNVF